MMVEKLKLVIRSPRFGLLLKTVIFWLLLEWRGGGVGIFATVFFVGIALFLYARPTFNALLYLPSFIVLLVMALVLPIADGSGVAVRFALTSLFYILLRLKELMFIRRLWWHEALVAGLLYLATLAYFTAGLSEYFLLKHLGLAAAFFVLAYELLATHGSFATWPRQRIAACVATLLFSELVWTIALLPIGYANATGVVAIFGFLLLHFLVIAATGYLKPVTVAKHVALAVLFAVIIALLSSWKV